MNKENEVLIVFDVLNKNDRIYKIEEFTRLREWDKKPDGTIYEGTLLEKLNRVMWSRKSGENERRKLDMPPLFGELGYPEKFEVSLGNVSHEVKNIKIVENTLRGDVNILTTPNGVILSQNVDAYVFRPRSTGKVNTDKTVSIEQLFSFDAVLKTTDSFPEVRKEPIFYNVPYSGPVGEECIIKDLEIENMKPLKPEMSFDDLMKADIRMCLITGAEPIPNTDKLLKLTIDTGSAPNQFRIVVSGIAKHFSTKDLIGRMMPFVLNLPVRKIKGVESFGMIIMAEDSAGNLKEVGNQDIQPGSTII